MELPSFCIDDRHFYFIEDNTSGILYLVELGYLAKIEPRWGAGGSWVRQSIVSYDISLINQTHPFFEEEALFLENVTEKKAAILKVIATIQSLVAAGLL